MLAPGNLTRRAISCAWR